MVKKHLALYQVKNRSCKDGWLTGFRNITGKWHRLIISHIGSNYAFVEYSLQRAGAIIMKKGVD